MAQTHLANTARLEFFSSLFKRVCRGFEHGTLALRVPHFTTELQWTVAYKNFHFPCDVSQKWAMQHVAVNQLCSVVQKGDKPGA